VSRAERIAEIVSLLRSLGHESALVGGVAVSIRARERFTKDVDLAVAVASDAQVEALAFGMQRRGFELTTVVEQESKRVVATLRFRPPGASVGTPGVDLLCASCGIEREIVEAAEPLEIAPGTVVPVARVSHLIAMKVLAVSEERDQDASDLRALLALASPREIEDARRALGLIEDRGFDRGKRMSEALDEFLRPSTP
jgi:predicted nucleotidyltransferase